MLFFLDRQILAILKTTICAQLGFGNTDYSMIVTAFLVPYTIMYLFAGRIIERCGIVAAGVICIGFMSVAEVLPAFAQGKLSLAAARFLLGTAEAGVVPIVTVALLRWFPTGQRAFACAIRAQIQALGSVLAPIIVVWTAVHVGWRWSFILTAIVGFGIMIIWWYTHLGQSIPFPEGEPVGSSYGFRSLLGNRVLWAVIALRLITDPFWYFLVFWQPAYIQESLHLSLSGLGAVAWIPPAVDAALKIVICSYSDRLVKRGWIPAAARIRTLLLIGSIVPLAFAVPLAHTVVAKITLISITYAMCDAWLVISTVLVTDTMPSAAVATTIGWISFVSGLVSIASSAFVGGIIDHYGFGVFFAAGAIAYPTAAILLARDYRRHKGYGGKPLAQAAEPAKLA
jgi:ACS family hexuronate transporter-like MFS transporter